MELLEALKTIRDECSTHNNCQRCPLRSKSDDDSCGLKERYPSEWDLLDDGVTIPKLFV